MFLEIFLTLWQEKWLCGRKGDCWACWSQNRLCTTLFILMRWWKQGWKWGWKNNSSLGFTKWQQLQPSKAPAREKGLNSTGRTENLHLKLIFFFQERNKATFSALFQVILKRTHLDQINLSNLSNTFEISASLSEQREEREREIFQHQFSLQTWRVASVFK